MVDLRAEVWARPGASTFERIYADVMAERLSGTVRANGIGDGQFEFPDHDDADTVADLLLDVDPADIANATRALIRVYADGQSYPPIHEWLVDAVVPPDDDADRWRVSGNDWLEWLNHAEVYPYDWDGSSAFTSQFPDHIWGGRNVLGDLRCSFTPEVVTLTPTAGVDAGTFTIGVSTDDGADTTAAIDYDATSLSVYNALLALSNVDALEVDGDAGGPWTVQFTAPDNQGWAVSTNNGNLAGSWSLIIDATGGTYDLTVENPDTSTDTATLNWDDDAATVESAIESLTTVTACTVTGTPSGGFTITFETPDFSPSLTTDATGLTGGASTAVATENAASVTVAIQTQGGSTPAGWTSSEFSPTDILHGTLQSLRCWSDGGFDPALPTGATTAGVFDGRAPYFPGVEEIARVKPGGIYQASVMVYARDTDTKIKLVLRDYADNQASAPSDTNYFVEQTVTADTWTELSITDFVPADTVDEVKFRIAHSDPDESVDPPIIYWALPKLLEGQAPTSIGGVWVSLYDDATSDHSGDGRIVWDDEANPGTPWLSLDFDATNDSAGNPWDTSDVEITAKRGWPYSRVLRETQQLGYEARIVPDPVTDGAWLLQMYNPAGMDAALGSSNTVGLRVGENVFTRQRKRFRPGGTTQTVEGDTQQFAFAENTSAITALGRMERYLPDRDLNGTTEIATAATAILADNITKADSRSYRIVDPDPTNVPLVDWVPGDTIPVLDPPAAEAGLRTAAIGYRKTPGLAVAFDVSITSERLTGNAAVRGAVIQYLREVREVREEPPGDTGNATTTRATSSGSQSTTGAHAHVNLASPQTIAVGGEAIAFDTIDSRIPFEGFPPITPGTSLTIPKTGYWNFAVQTGWDSYTGGGTVTVTRTRGGVTETVYPSINDPGIWTATSGSLFEGEAKAVPCIAGDTIQIVIDHNDGSTQDLVLATLDAYLVDRATQSTFDQYRDVVLADSPVAYWRLGELSGTTATDETGNGYDGTYTNSPTLNQTGVMRDGYGDTSVDFPDSSDEHVDVDVIVAAIDGQTVLTVEAWINLDNVSTLQPIWIVNDYVGAPSTGANRIGIWVNTSGEFMWQEGNTKYVSATTLVAGQRYHVVVTRDATPDVKLYVNGALDATHTSVTGRTASTADGDTAQIALDYNDGPVVAEVFDGLIDEVAVYTTVLSAERVARHYAVGIQGG